MKNKLMEGFTILTTLNHKKIIENITKIQNYKGYLPLILHSYVGLDYYDKLNSEDLSTYYEHRTELQRMGTMTDYCDYLEKELSDWLQDNPEFEDIIF